MSLMMKICERIGSVFLICHANGLPTKAAMKPMGMLRLVPNWAWLPWQHHSCPKQRLATSKAGLSAHIYGIPEPFRATNFFGWNMGICLRTIFTTSSGTFLEIKHWQTAGRDGEERSGAFHADPDVSAGHLGKPFAVRVQTDLWEFSLVTKKTLNIYLS